MGLKSELLTPIKKFTFKFQCNQQVFTYYQSLILRLTVTGVHMHMNKDGSGFEKYTLTGSDGNSIDMYARDIYSNYIECKQANLINFIQG
jgi:hypothetical protein